MYDLLTIIMSFITGAYAMRKYIEHNLENQKDGDNDNG